MDSLSMALLIEERIINIRRAIHQNPEVSHKEFKTQELITNYLKEINVEYQKVGNTSIIAKIIGKKESKKKYKVIALRADMDALKMHEETMIEFKSRVDGVGHMCGHDAHTAMLLGASLLLKENEHNFFGEVRLFFQEAEEVLGGSNLIIEAKGMENVDRIFALHCLEKFYAGEVSISSGFQLAGGNTIKLKWYGNKENRIKAACFFISSIQSIITKSINPLETIVLSCGKFHSESSDDEECSETNFTFRYFNNKIRDIVFELVRKHSNIISNINEVSVEVQIKQGVKATYNNPLVVNDAIIAYKKINGINNVKEMLPLLSSEDFSRYLDCAPGAIAWLGIRSESIEAIYYPHHEKFNIDESALKYGVAWFYQICLDFLD